MTESARARRADDVTACPLGHRCESCGTAVLPLTVQPVPCELGVMCMTLCAGCTSATCAPAVTIECARRFVDQHAMHVAARRDVDPPSGILRRGITPDVPWPYPA